MIKVAKGADCAFVRVGYGRRIVFFSGVLRRKADPRCV